MHAFYRQSSLPQDYEYHINIRLDYSHSNLSYLYTESNVCIQDSSKISTDKTQGAKQMKQTRTTTNQQEADDNKYNKQYAIQHMALEVLRQATGIMTTSEAIVIATKQYNNGMRPLVS